MIGYVHGKLAYKLENAVVVDTGGVGYEIFAPSSSPVFLAREGEEVRLFTVMIVKEDEMSLYGFEDRESVHLFRKLLTVSGIGAKAALSVLSAMPTSEAIRAIIFGDATMLTRANGVGKKSAERIVLELSDKLQKTAGPAPGTPEGTQATSAGDAKAFAIEALLSLGYTRSEAGVAVMGIEEEGLTVEEYLKRALRSMG
ncbi:MAG: Holliday junction branch migration protein RuvA [Clostridiales Family XIII bacterium]|jgi:Holliday junction DNA helicase RuvA|nr:Holliday junction branch migration protein RuvA [Clostridiales Family XIII bacterium]